MRIRHEFGSVLLSLSLFGSHSSGEEFVFRDSDTTVSNTTISPRGLSDGDTIRFEGTIRAPHMGVMIHPVPSDLTLQFTSSSVVEATDRAATAIILGTSFDGRFVQEGTVLSSHTGICFAQGFSGSAWNSGRVAAEGVSWLFAGDFSGSFENSGISVGGADGLFVMGSFTGEITNTGIIEGGSGDGIHLMQGTSGVVRNMGGRITGGTNAITLGMGNGTVVLSGPSRISGGIDGGAGNDTLRFENMRGISVEKQRELARLDRTDPASGTVSLFGETIEWSQFENIEADLSTLFSYESLLSSSGLGGYGRALDNVQSLDDDSRRYLQALSEVEDGSLEAVAANLSGQTLLSAWDNFGREQDSRLFGLLGNQFSSLRGSVSGRGQSTAWNRSGLFANEVPAGISVDSPETETTVYASGYVGGGEYDPESNRADSRYDATSMIFGMSREVSEHWNLGFFGGYGRNEAQIDSFGSEMETRSVQAGVTAQYVNGMFFANLTAGYGFLDSESTRRDFLGNTMRGDREGDQGLFYFQSGWDLPFGIEERGRVTPYGGLVLSATSLEGFTESGPALASLRFQDDSITSLQSILGLSVQGHLETSTGWIKPQIDAAFWHALDGDESSTVSLATAGFLNPYTLGLEASDESRAVLQIGADFSFDILPNWIFNAGYFGSFGDDGHSSHGGVFGVKIDF